LEENGKLFDNEFELLFLVMAFEVLDIGVCCGRGVDVRDDVDESLLAVADYLLGVHSGDLGGLLFFHYRFFWVFIIIFLKKLPIYIAHFFFITSLAMGVDGIWLMLSLFYCYLLIFLNILIEVLVNYKLMEMIIIWMLLSTFSQKFQPQVWGILGKPHNIFS
jgi:hypothetical protein